MKTLLTTTLLAAGLSLSVNANAASLTHNGYTLDTDTNIVTGGGLQWLQWDVTVGMSINQALSMYGSGGWELASNLQMEGLLDTFFDPTINWGIENQVNRQEIRSPAYSTNSTANQFINLFGDTRKHLSPQGYEDTLEQSMALFGKDADGDGRYNQVAVLDEFRQTRYHYYPSVAWVWADSWTTDSGSLERGVALVRNINVSAVPVPAAAFLFAPALLGFLGLRHRRRA